MRQMAVLDADDTEIESWITVRGNHIPIKKGQSKEDAVKSFIASKGGNTEKGSNKKSELGLIYHKDKGHVKEGRPPKGWAKVEGATTAPNGYSWYSNGKSMFGGERESYLYKDEKEDKAAKKEYPAEFETVRKNAKANPYLYDLRYTQKSKAKAYEEYKKDTEKKDKAYNDKGLYQDALNELDDQIADKEKELENIHLSMTENAEAGYFDIASANMVDIEFVKGQLEELKKKREKLAGSSGTKAPKVTKVDAKKWNSPASDPWKSLYD